MLAALMQQSNIDSANLVDAIQGVGKSFDLDRAKKMGRAFIAHGDFSPQGLQTFAQQNNLSTPEMYRLTKVMQLFGKYQKSMAPAAPKYVDVAGVDSQGNPTKTYMTAEEAAQSGPHRTGTAKTNLDQLIASRLSGAPLPELLSTKKKITERMPTLSQLIAAKAGGEPLDKLLALRGGATGLQKEYDRYKANNPNYKGDLIAFKSAMSARDPVKMALSLAQNDNRVLIDPTSLGKVAKEYLQEMNNLRGRAKANPGPPSAMGALIENLLTGK